MRIKKPCPGCGEVRGRKADEVCSNCAHAIKMWAEHTTKAACNPEMEVIRLKGAYYWYPMFYFGGPHASIEGHSETRDELGRLFDALGRILSTNSMEWREVPSSLREKADALYFRPDFRHPLKKGESYPKPIDYPSSDGEGSSYDTYVQMDKRVLELLRALWDRTARFAEMSYYGGVLDGKNLLLQLSSGEMSSSQLTEEDIRLARRVQNSRDLHRRTKKIRLSSPSPIAKRFSSAAHPSVGAAPEEK